MKLIFVYNADSGLASTLLDIGHKLLSPQTYACRLCALTHGAFNERAAWSAFRERSPHRLEFLHRDEFEARYPSRPVYPVILRERDGALEELLGPADLATFPDLETLIARLESLPND